MDGQLGGQSVTNRRKSGDEGEGLLLTPSSRAFRGHHPEDPTLFL